MKYTRSAIGLLTSQYRSVLKKCFLINMGLYALGVVAAAPAMADHTEITDNANLSGTYQDSTANDDGGVFFVKAEGKTVEINSSEFTGNSVTGSGATGGAISLQLGTLNIDDTVFTGNKAPYSGAIFTYSGGNKLKITNSQFNSNEALGAGALQAMFETEIKDTSFTGNRATADDGDGGGALFVGAVGKTKLDNVTFTNNTSATRGGAISTRSADVADNSEAKIDILGSTFTGNTAGTTGGAIDNYMYGSVEDATAVYIDGTTFTNNTANKGGAVYNHGQTDKAGKTSSLKIVNSTFNANGVDATSGDVVAQKGGAIYNEAHASMSIEGTFTGNKAVEGGAIYNEGEMTVNSATFTENTATAQGGAIYNKDDLTIQDSSFENNSTKNGGAIVNEGSLSIDNSQFIGNTITGSNSGVIWNKGTQDSSISNSIFSGNYTAKNNSLPGGYGGAIYNASTGKLTLENNTFSGNGKIVDEEGNVTVKTNMGGAIYNIAGTLDIKGGSITDNVAKTGSAIYNKSNLNINGTSISYNVAALSATTGGAIYNKDGFLDIKNADIHHNTNLVSSEGYIVVDKHVVPIGTVTSGNGGFLFNDAKEKTSNIKDGNISYNKAYIGGGIYNTKGTIEIDGTTFEGNSALNNGGAVANINGSTTKTTAVTSIKNTTFANNVATGLGGAIYNGSQTLILDGSNKFSGNKSNVVWDESGAITSSVANDIYNNGGIINIISGAGEVNTFEGGIAGNNQAAHLNINGAGTVDMKGNLTNHTVNVNAGELHLSNGAADGSNVAGSAITVADGAIINTIDDVINDYSSKITLQDGANIKLDVDVDSEGNGQNDKYAVTSAANIAIKQINLLSALSGGVSDTTFTIATAGNFTIDSAVAESIKAYTSDKTFSLVDSSEAGAGKIALKGVAGGGLDDAVDNTAVDKDETVVYQVTADETFDGTGGDTTIDRAEFTIEGGNKTITATNADSLKVASTSDVTITDLKLAGFDDAAIDNAGNTTMNNVTFEDSNGSAIKNSGSMKLTNSKVHGDVYNSGTFDSDPNDYYGTVTNAAGATMNLDGDIFHDGAQFDNLGIASFDNDVTFDSSSVAITGDGTINLKSTSNTKFNAGGTVNSNTINLASGANFTGTLAGTGVLNAQNNNIDTISGSVSGGDLYLDANLVSKTIDSFVSASGATIQGIKLASAGYDSEDEVKLDLNGATLASNATIEGTNYYTKMEVDSSGNLVFSDKLINSSTIRGKGTALAPDGDVVIGDKADNTQIGTANVNLTIDESDKKAELISGVAGNGAHIALDSKTSKSVDISAGDTTANKSANIDVNGTDGKIKLEAIDTGATKTAKVEVDGTNAQVKATAANGLVISNGTAAQDATLTTDANGLHSDKTVFVGTKGTKLTDSSLVISDGAATPNTATLTSTASGLNVAEGLTVGAGTYGINSSGYAALNGLTTDGTNGVDLGISGKQTDITGSTVNVGDTTAGKASVVVDNTASAEKTTITGGTSKIEMNSANGAVVTGNFTSTNGTNTLGNTNVTGTFSLAGTAVTSNADELNTLHSSGVSNADFVKLHAVTSTAAELNKLAGNAVTADDFTKLHAVESTATELNELHSSGATNADFVKLHAVESTAAELNQLHGKTVDGTTGTGNTTLATVATVNNKITAAAGDGLAGSDGKLSVALTSNGGLQLDGTTPNKTLSVATDDATITKNTSGQLKVVDGGIDTTQLANSAVTLAKINSSAMTSAAVAANSTDTKLVNATSLALTRQAIDSDANAVLGGVYAIDGSAKTVSYNASALSDMYKSTAGTAGTNLTGSLNNAAERISAATGTVFTSAGGFTNTYTNTAAVNYGVIANTTNLTSAVSQVASNIGTPVTSTNYVATGNTVNANLTALDAGLGEKIAANGNYIKSSATNSVNANIQALDTAIGAKEAGTYIASDASVNTNLKALDTNLKTASDKNSTQDTAIGNIYTAMNGGTYNATSGSVTGATTLTAKAANGTDTAGDITEGVNAASSINASQNTSMSALAGVVDGGFVSVAGVRTAGEALTAYDGKSTLTGVANKLATNKQENLIIAANSGLQMAADNKTLSVKLVNTTDKKSGLELTDGGLAILTGDSMNVDKTSGKLDIKYSTAQMETTSSEGLRIKDGGVNTTQIANGAVTADKIATSAVTADKLATDSVVTAKIANTAVTFDKLNSNVYETAIGEGSNSKLATTLAVKNYVGSAITDNAEKGTYTGTNVTGSSAATIKAALTATNTQVNTNTTDISTLKTWQTKLGTSGGAANAVHGSNIVASSVTTNQLDAGVNSSLGLANSALQKVYAGTTDVTNTSKGVTIATGSTNGTIAVNGTDVSVAGLGTMAYETASNYYTSAQTTSAIETATTMGSAAGNNYAENSTVVNAVKSIDTKIGNLNDLTTTSKTTVVSAINEVKSSAGDAQGEIDKIETALGVLNTDGTYKNSTLANLYRDTSGTAGATLEASLNNAAARISAATGSAYASDGSFSNAYTTQTVGADINTSDSLVTAISKVNTNLENILNAAGTRVDGSKVDVAWNSTQTALNTVLGNGVYANNASVNYTPITAGTNLTTAVSQVASNIGTAITGTTRAATSMSTNAGNTVNQNIAALDASIGSNVTSTNYAVAANSANANISALDAGMGAKIATNGNFIKASSTNSINQNISALDTAIGDMSGFGSQNYAKNTTNVAANITALDTQVKSNTDDIAAINTKITVTSNGNYIASAKTAAQNLDALDTALKSTNDIVGAAQTTAATTGILSGKKIGTDVNLVNAIDTVATKAASTAGDNTFTGKTTFQNDDGITIKNTSGANTTQLTAIANGTDSMLNVSTGVKVNGDEIVIGNFTATAGTTNLGTTNVAGNFTATSGTTTLGATTVSSLTIGAGTVSAIDTDGTYVTSTGTTAMATGATVYNGAEKGKFTSTISSGSNITGGSTATIGSAINDLDAAIGAPVTSTNYASTSNSVNANISALDKAIGDMSGFASQNYAKNTTNVAANITALDTQVKANYDAITVTADGNYIKSAKTAAQNLGILDTNLKATNDTIGAGTVGAGTAGNLATKVIGTSYTVTNAVADLNQTNVNQNSSMSSMATLIDGRTVGADGALTGTATQYSNATLGAYQTVVDTDNLKTAIGKVNSNLNNILYTSGTDAGKVDGSKVGVNWNSTSSTTALDTVLGTGTYTSTNNITSGESITTSLNSLDATIGGAITGTGGLLSGVTLGNGSGETSVAGALSTVSNTIGAAQTTAATTGILADEKIGTDINLVNAINKVATKAASLTGDNKFTGANTFANDAGITIKNTSESLSTQLTATGDGLNVSTGIKANGQVAATSFKAGTNTTLADGTLTVGNGTTSSTLTHDTLTTSAVNADTVAASTSVTIGTTSTATTLTSDSNGLNINKGLTVAGSETVSGAITVDGSASLGKISGTKYAVEASSTGVAANALLTANEGLTVADGKATNLGGTLTVADGKSTTLGGTLKVKDAATFDSTVKADGLITANAGLTVKSGQNFTLGGKDVNAIDTDGSAVSSAGTAATTLATGATVYNGAENAKFTSTVATGSNITGTTLKTAINNLDDAIGNRAAMTNGSGADWTTPLSGKKVADAITQVASNIGTAVTTTKGNVLAANTVNQNLEKIDTNIGDISVFASSQTGNLSNSATPSATTNAKDVATAISNIDQTLGKIHGLYKDGTVNVTPGGVASKVNGHSNLAEGTTVENHLVSLDNAIGDRTLVSANTKINEAMAGTSTTSGSLAAGLKAAGDVIGDGDFSGTRYASSATNVSDAIRSLDSNIGRVEHDVRDLRHDFRSGMASLSAMSALVPNPRACGDTSLSIGTGAYDGHTAVALGGFHYLTDNVMLNAGAAWGNSNDVSYRLGVTWSW